MTSSDQINMELFRVRVVLVAMLIAIAFLVVSMWRIQVLDVSKYRTNLDRQSIRRVRLPGIRGAISDRNGVCMAQNRPSYCMAIYIEELRQAGSWNNTINEVEKVISRLSEVLLLKPEVTRSDIKNHIRRRLPLPFLAWRDLDQTALARWAENGAPFPGVDVYIEPVRVYPLGAVAGHMLGHVGRADPKRNRTEEEEEAEEPYDFYLPEMEGKSGVERLFNNELSGIAGGCLIRVDASGFKHSEINEQERGRKEPISGDDVALTIDLRIQQLAEKVLGKAFHGEDATVKGAAIVLDPRNGDVLAMVSSPSVDANIFASFLSVEEWKKLESDPDKPLLNRAISGLYPPGSTFKPLVAITALETGRATPGTSFNCFGYFELGDVRFRCWQESGHGFLPMRKAIEQSCNAYFCQLGLASGYERLYRMADAVGFGHRTGSGLGGEQAGWLPKKMRGWSGGDTCNISIGQGALLVTPLQMAVFTAAIANGGYIHKPRLLLRRGESSGEVTAKMAWSASTLRLVRGGMHDVVEADSGTGKRARIQGVEMAGKTGTAEFGPKEKRRKYTWMTVFAPFDSPRYAVAFVVEEGVSGGITVAPCVRELMTGIFAFESGTAQMANAFKPGDVN